MGKRELEPVPADMVALRGQIEAWRSTRKGLCAMPADLWDSAAKIAARHGIYATATIVGVSYDALAKRVKNAMPASRTAVSFVEWSGAEILANNMAAGSVVEVSDSAGRQLSIRLAQGDKADVASIVAAFCSGSS